MIVVAGDVLCTVSIRLLESLFSVSICRSLVSFTPAGSTTDQMLSSPFRIAGICAEIQRTWAPGKQWVCILPSANVAWTCRMMETLMITASRHVPSCREERSGCRWRSRRPEAVRSSEPGSLLPLLHPGSVVSQRWSEGHLGRSRPGCTGPAQRNTRSRGGGSVSSGLHTYPGFVGVSPGCFQRCSPLP